MHPRDRIAYRTLALQSAGLWRLPEDGRGARGPGTIDTRSNDYLGLGARAVSRETALSERGAVEGAKLGAGASRLVSGTWDEHEALEVELASWLGFEASLLFTSGYAANVGAFSALVGPGETVISDSLNHASIIDGCRLSRGRTVIIPHGDLTALEQALAGTEGVRWVALESYYGMDGDSPDLRRVRELCDAHQAALIVDEAHALGVFGAEGRGICADQGVVPDVLVGGLGKAVGSQGGFVATTRLFREWLWNRARSFVFSTGSSPWLCVQTRASVAAVRAADRERERLGGFVAQLQERLLGSGVELPPGRHGPVFPILLGSEEAVMGAAAVTAGLGVLCQPIRPPTVPAGGARLRVSLRASMQKSEVDTIASAIEAAWRAHRGRSSAESGVASGLAAYPGDARAVPAAKPASSEVYPSGGDVRELGQATTSASVIHLAVEPSGGDVRELGQAGGEAKPAAARTGVPGPLGAPMHDRGHEGRSPRWIVLGVGTGVGKTYVARALVAALVARARPVAGLKPIETGIDVLTVGSLQTDAGILERASFHVKHPRPHPLYSFRDPITPALAARREGRRVDLETVRRWVDAASPLDPAEVASLTCVIETAGGVFSPIGDGIDNLDLARALGEATWILVASDRLGVLHEVSSTLTAMRARGAAPDHLVLSAPAVPDASTGTNADELRRLSGMPPIIELPRAASKPLIAGLVLDAGRTAPRPR